MCTIGAKWACVAQQFPVARHCLHETDILFAEPACRPVVAEVSKPAADSSATNVDRPTEDGADATSEKKARLAPGGLRGMVEDYLRDHPAEQFGPTAIANALGGKSSGAVSNALDKLVDDGVATKRQDKPRRFALAPSEQESSPRRRSNASTTWRMWLCSNGIPLGHNHIRFRSLSGRQISGIRVRRGVAIRRRSGEVGDEPPRASGHRVPVWCGASVTSMRSTPACRAAAMVRATRARPDQRCHWSGSSWRRQRIRRAWRCGRRAPRGRVS